MSRAKRLQPVLRMAQQKVEEASQALGYLNQRIAEESATKNQLSGYEGEYLELMRSSHEAGKNMNINATLNYQVFIQRLKLAQIEQQEAINLLESQKQQVMQHWIKTRARQQAVEAVIASAKAEEELIASRQEQKLLDELTSLNLQRGKLFN